MSNPVVLPVAMNEQLSKAVTSAVSIDEIRAAVVSEAEKQAAEKTASDAAAATAAAKTANDAAAVAANQTFKRTVTIGGKDFEFEESTELALERAVNNALTIAFSLQSTTPEPVVAPVVEKQPTEEEKVAAAADLELKFKRGEITTAEYLKQSGAVDEYLAAQGVSIASLKETVEKSQTEKFEQSWAEATTEFLQSPAGADWPGGEKNKTLIGIQLAAMGLVDAKDKVAAMAQAYAAMKSQGIVMQPTEAEIAAVKGTSVATTKAAAVVSTTPTSAALAAAAASAAKKEVTSSSLFGASSGVGASVLTGTEAAESKFDIPANATPAEILDAWKKAQIAGGKDPNAAFTETFSTRK